MAQTPKTKLKRVVPKLMIQKRMHKTFGPLNLGLEQ
jgi:hypothetical protein